MGHAFFHKNIVFPAKLNIPILLPILGWKYSCNILNYSLLTVQLKMSRVWITRVWCLDLYHVTLCCNFKSRCHVRLHLAVLALNKSISHRNTVMKTKVSDFVSTASKTIKCDHCSKLFQRRKLCSFHKFSLRFLFKMFSKFRKFHPRYSYKTNSSKKERVHDW